MSRQVKQFVIVASIAVAVVILPPVLVPLFYPWTAINCRRQDINIKTGQRRDTRMLWYVAVSERISDTPISKLLQGKSVDVAPGDPWRRVNTFSPWDRNSPHHVYHGALSQIREMVLAFELRGTPPEEQVAIAERLLTLWQTGGRSYSANDYLRELLENKTDSTAPSH
ncbi:MAG TPA: hypothetical protein VEJ63_17395 [Planctomycetota bacterium]|nr:hypothetical protein [Planctomycetota bacterium]